MKKWLLIGLILLLVLVGVIYAITLRKSDTATPDTVDPFDFASTTPVTRNGELEITNALGGKIAVPDFTKENQPEIAGPDTGYQVAGSQEERYHILYFPDQSYFLVSLLSEPLGEVRLAAEEELRTRLLLSNAELCSLNLEVRTTAEVNETYAGNNLGLSFCPGAVVLP